jgi:hypothetical protein
VQTEAATGEIKGRPQSWQSGGVSSRKESRHFWQMGMRLTDASVSRQSRQGAGKNREATESKSSVNKPIGDPHTQRVQRDALRRVIFFL